MNSERTASVSSLITICIRGFYTLLDSIPDEQTETRLQVEDDLGRLRVWVGNLGAHRKQTDRLSLDYRLREAPDLHKEVRNHIDDISEAVQGAITLFREDGKPPKIDDAPSTSEMDDSDSDDSSSDSDGFWEELRAENEQYSELDEYMLDIQFTITSLYKFSITLQNPAHRDRTAQASRINLSHFECFDIQHVSDKYNLPRDCILAERLGKANTKRRQLLAYHKDHAEKISKYVDVAVEKIVSAKSVSEDPPKTLNQDQSIQNTQSISTIWTQNTNASTIYSQNIEVASDSGQTKFSATTSTAGDQAYTLMPPLPPDAMSTAQNPVGNIVQNTPFLCPYCRQTIQLENKTEDWYYHVYSDLRPYICTIGGCVKSNQLYDSYTEWSAHEREFHRREWTCPWCSCICNSKESFCKHLEDDHSGVFPQYQRQAVVEVSERAILSAQQCPLCEKPPISNPSRFQQHLARHLQVLALFVLPSPEFEDAERANNDGESDESQQVFIVDDESRISLRSASTGQSSSVVEKTPAMSEQSISDGDQLEVTETESQREFQEPMVQEHSPILESADDYFGALYHERGKLDEAERIYIRNLGVKEKALGSNHISILHTLHNLGDLYYAQRKLDEAEQIYTRVLAWEEKALGPDHAITLSAISSLGNLFHDQGRLDEAEQMFLRALAGLDKLVRQDYVSMSSVVSNLENVYRAQGRLDQAERMETRGRADFTRMMADREQAARPDYLLIFATVNVLRYRDNGRLDEAEQRYAHALTGFEETMGPYGRLTLDAINRLGVIYRDQGKMDEAEQCFIRAGSR